MLCSSMHCSDYYRSLAWCFCAWAKKEPTTGRNQVYETNTSAFMTIQNHSIASIIGRRHSTLYLSCSTSTRFECENRNNNFLVECRNGKYAESATATDNVRNEHQPTIRLVTLLSFRRLVDFALCVVCGVCTSVYSPPTPLASNLNASSVNINVIQAILPD